MSCRSYRRGLIDNYILNNKAGTDIIAVPVLLLLRLFIQFYYAIKNDIILKNIPRCMGMYICFDCEVGL